ncbi:MAG: zf-HC2 domain-containing protein [Acidobacteriaceae bacterium]
MLPSGPHDEFLELCAVSTSGQLSEEEQNRLQEHLAVCPACREAFREYESVVNDAIPAIGAEQTNRIDPGPGFSQSKAERAFFDRLAKEDGRQPQDAEKNNGIPSAFRRVLPIAPESTWRHVWMLYAAGILLFVTLCLSAYWIGVRHGTDVARSTPAPALQTPSATETAASLEEQLSDAAHEREIARSQITQRDKALADLRRQLQQQSAEISRMKEAQDKLEATVQSDQAGKQDLVQQRSELGQKLEAAQAESRTLQEQVNSLAQQSTTETSQAKALGSKVEDLTRLLEDREKALNQQDELLAHDRDIREVMGARNLYIAEVYDTDENGATRRPYGRVFYTKEKSLIFYAYDLDQQGSNPARTFQAWGRRGPDFKQAVSLGIFYEDNSSKKRWVLKSEDPKTLAQIDAVFVTVEPHGGSGKPSGKPLLFAYLRVNPNHP